MNREFFCGKCGLFYWEPVYTENNPGSGTYTCPDCKNSTMSQPLNLMVYAVDSLAFFYFCESDTGKEALKNKWSSPKYAPDDVIEIYRTQNIMIKE